MFTTARIPVKTQDDKVVPSSASQNREPKKQRKSRAGNDKSTDLETKSKPTPLIVVQSKRSKSAPPASDKERSIALLLQPSTLPIRITKPSHNNTCTTDAPDSPPPSTSPATSDSSEDTIVGTPPSTTLASAPKNNSLNTRPHSAEHKPLDHLGVNRILHCALPLHDVIHEVYDRLYEYGYLTERFTIVDHFHKNAQSYFAKSDQRTKEKMSQAAGSKRQTKQASKNKSARVFLNETTVVDETPCCQAENEKSPQEKVKRRDALREETEIAIIKGAKIRIFMTELSDVLLDKSKLEQEEQKQIENWINYFGEGLPKDPKTGGNKIHPNIKFVFMGKWKGKTKFEFDVEEDYQSGQKFRRSEETFYKIKEKNPAGIQMGLRGPANIYVGRRLKQRGISVPEGVDPIDFVTPEEQARAINHVQYEVVIIGSFVEHPEFLPEQKNAPSLSTKALEEKTTQVLETKHDQMVAAGKANGVGTHAQVTQELAASRRKPSSRESSPPRDGDIDLRERTLAVVAREGFMAFKPSVDENIAKGQFDHNRHLANFFGTVLHTCATGSMSSSDAMQALNDKLPRKKSD